MPINDPIFDGRLTLAELFARPTAEAWRKAARKSLGGRPLESVSRTTHEGIFIEPLYTSDGPERPIEYPGLPPFTRGRHGLGNSPGGWEACQRYDHPEIERSARWASEDASRGVTSAWFALDGAARLGLDADSERAAGLEVDGLIASTADDLEVLARSLEPSITRIHLDGGGNAVGVAAAFFAAAERCGHAPASFSGALHVDPLGALASDGELSYGLDQSLALMADLVAWADRSAPGIRAVTVSSLPYAASGATATQELAYILGTGVAYLRALDAAGLELKISSRQLHLVTSVGRDLFVEVAKLRALRRCWARVIDACGGSPTAQAPPIHAVSSPRCLAGRDPWVNLLRSTEHAFAAVIGGADVLTILPFDTVLGAPDDPGRRIAANTHAVLREESHLHRVADPTGGSHYVEHLTDELSRLAWEHFQRIEGSGGMRAAFESGRLGDEISSSLAQKRAAVATRRDPVTGVSSFPNLSEEAMPGRRTDAPRARSWVADRLASHRGRFEPSSELDFLRDSAGSAGADGSVTAAAIEAFAAGATISQVADALRADAGRTRVVPLVAEREGWAFERLRDASDRCLASRGRRPGIFLAGLGPIPEHWARADFARNLLNAGGIEVVDNEGFSTVESAADAWALSGTSMAVVCASDERAQDLARPVVRALKKRGARAVLVVGEPRNDEATWRAAGADSFLFAGCDVLAVLTELLTSDGALDG